jgi:hypothetical protein
MEWNGTRGLRGMPGQHKAAPGRNTGIVTWLCIAAITALMLAAPLQKSNASEGGGSSFTPGAQGDFGMCFLPPGLHVKNSIIYTEGELNDYPGLIECHPLLGTQSVESKLETEVWFDLLQIVYSSEFKILGGRYFASLNIPVILSQELKTSSTFPAVPIVPAVEDKSTTSGLGDIQIVPFGLIWDFGSFHILAAQNLVLETGRYDEDKTNNTGRNYFSYDELLGATWLDEERGHEVSFLAGYMINTRNDKTEYKTGNEFHVDFTLSQHFSRQFGVGVVGYYYKQLTDDDSPELDSINAFNGAAGLERPGGYKSEGAAAGPSLIYSPTIGGKDVHFIAKWLHEFSTENRLEGEWVWLSVCTKF